MAGRAGVCEVLKVARDDEVGGAVGAGVGNRVTANVVDLQPSRFAVRARARTERQCNDCTERQTVKRQIRIENVSRSYVGSAGIDHVAERDASVAVRRQVRHVLPPFRVSEKSNFFLVLARSYRRGAIRFNVS